MTELPIALEITPPILRKPHVLLRRAAALADRPGFTNVISRPDRWPSLDASIFLRQHGFEPVWHLANRGRSADLLVAEIARARAAGLRRVLCIRGEHDTPDRPDTPKIREVVEMLGRGLPEAHIAVAFNHHRAHESAQRILFAKLDAGAHSVQTQLTFDLDSLRPFAENIKRRDPNTGIAPMLMPVVSEDAAFAAARRLSIPVPTALVRALARHGPEAGWHHFAKLLASIRANPLYDGVAIMTPIDLDPALAERLALTLTNSGARDRTPVRRRKAASRSECGG